MPGAPNRPPEGAGAPPAPPITDEPARHALRRLAPCRVTLSLEIWRGAPSPELLTPLEKAEAAYAAGDLREAESQLDALAIRLHEPRWPSVPEPFRSLRVAIPRPQPPAWDPELAMEAAEKARRQRRRAAEQQLALARASVELLKRRALATEDLEPVLAQATELMAAAELSDGFFERVDRLWDAVRARLPMPKVVSARPVTPMASEPSAEAA